MSSLSEDVNSEAVETEIDRVTSEGESPIYKSYKKRWLVLTTVVILNISNSILWINNSPIVYESALYYDVSPGMINWFSLIYLIVSIPFSFISTFIVDRLGLKFTVHIGAIFNTIGAILRALGTSNFIQPKSTQFAISLFGQTIAAMAQSFILYIPTKVSQLWFPKDQRGISTSIMSISNPFGMVIAEGINPFIVKTEKDIPLSNYIWLIPALIAQLMIILIVTTSKPKTPPSQSVEKEEKRLKESYFQQLKMVFTDKNYILLLICLGSGIGLFSGLATVTNQVLCPLGYSKEFSGISTASLILCGFVGSGICGVIVDKTKGYTPVTKVAFSFAAVALIILLEFFLVPDKKLWIILFSCVFGFFGVGAYPVGLELSVEATYPVEETISTAFIFMTGQVFGVFYIALISLLSVSNSANASLQVCGEGIEPKEYTTSLLVCMGVFTIIVCIFVLFFDSRYKRLEAETPDNLVKRDNEQKEINYQNSNDQSSISETPMTPASNDDEGLLEPNEPTDSKATDL